MNIKTNTMKTPIILFLIAFNLSAFAQKNPNNHPKKEKIESMRIGFLTQKLELTSEEAQKFWPVYNEYQKKRDAIHESRMKEKMKYKTGLDSLSDAQVEELVDAEIIFKQKGLELQKEYHIKFKSVLPIKKVAKLYRAEDQFTHQLLEHISEGSNRKEGHGSGREGNNPDSRRPNPYEEK